MTTPQRSKPSRVGKAKVDSVCGVGFGSQHEIRLTAHAIGNELFNLSGKSVLIVPADGTYTVKLAGRGKKNGK